MASSCEFKTTEASTKAFFRTNNLIDRFLNILDLPKFRSEVSKWTAFAKSEFNVDKGNLFHEEQGGKKAVPNKEAFKAIDKAKGNDILYGVADTNDPEAIKEATEAIHAFLDKIGVQQDLVDRPENAPKSAIAGANFIKGTIDIFQDARSEGVDSPEKLAAFWKKVESKMPEEAAHWWFRLLRNETDLKQALWTAHQTEVKANALYKGRYGKLVDKAEDLKEEAIGQLIAEAANRIVTGKATNEDKTFLQKVFDWINSILNKFRDSNLEIELSELQSRLEYNKYTEDPFERAAIRILEKDITDLHSLSDYMNVVSKLEDDEINKAVKLWKNSTNAGLVVEGGEQGSTFNEDEDNDIFKGEDGLWYITDRDGNVRLDKAPPAKVKVGYSRDGVFYGITLTFKTDETSQEAYDDNILEVEIENEGRSTPGNLLSTLEHLIPEVHSYTNDSKVELFELITSDNIQKQLGALKELLLKSDYQKEKERIQGHLTNLYNQISANNSFVTILQRLHREGAFDFLPMKLDKTNPNDKQAQINIISKIYRDYVKQEKISYPYSNVVQDWLMKAVYFNREYFFKAGLIKASSAANLELLGIVKALKVKLVNNFRNSNRNIDRNKLQAAYLIDLLLHKYGNEHWNASKKDDIVEEAMDVIGESIGEIIKTSLQAHNFSKVVVPLQQEAGVSADKFSKDLFDLKMKRGVNTSVNGYPVWNVVNKIGQKVNGESYGLEPSEATAAHFIAQFLKKEGKFDALKEKYSTLYDALLLKKGYITGQRSNFFKLSDIKDARFIAVLSTLSTKSLTDDLRSLLGENYIDRIADNADLSTEYESRSVIRNKKLNITSPSIEDYNAYFATLNNDLVNESIERHLVSSTEAAKGEIAVLKLLEELKYDPTEAYKRGYAFYHGFPGYSGRNFTLSNIKDFVNEIVFLTDGGFITPLSTYTEKVNPALSHERDWHMLGGRKQSVRIKIFPSSEDIKLSGSNDIYSGQRTTVALSKTPEEGWSQDVAKLNLPLFKLSVSRGHGLEDSIANSIENRSHNHNEQVIYIKKGTFKFEYDEELGEEVKAFLDEVNSKLGSITEPAINHDYIDLSPYSLGKMGVSTHLELPEDKKDTPLGKLLEKNGVKTVEELKKLLPELPNSSKGVDMDSRLSEISKNITDEEVATYVATKRTEFANIAFGMVQSYKDTSVEDEVRTKKRDRKSKFLEGITSHDLSLFGAIGLPQILDYLDSTSIDDVPTIEGLRQYVNATEPSTHPDILYGLDEEVESTEQTNEPQTGKPGTFTVWHGSETDIREFKDEFPEGYFHQAKGGSPKAIFFSKDKAPSDSVYGKRPYQKQFQITMNNPLVVNYSNPKGNEGGKTREQWVQKAINEGHDGLVWKNIHDNFVTDVYVVLDAKNIASTEKETTTKVKKLLARLGIKIDASLEASLGVNGVADLLNKIIKVVKGEIGDNALPEEAMHFIVAAIKDKYPSLYAQMEKEIWKYKIYSETLAEYRNNPLYQKNGKPDLDKIKQEAIGKLLAGTIINEDLTDEDKLIDTSKKWWAKVLDALRDLFNKITDNPFEDPFDLVANKAFDDDFILPEDIKNLSQATSFLQLGVPAPDKQKALFDKLTDDMASGRYKKVQVPGDRHYEINGKKLFMSVTEYKKQIIEKQHRFAERTESQKFRDAFSAEWGTAIDDTINHILERFVDPTTGLLRTKPNERPKKTDGSFDLAATPIGKAEMTLRGLAGPTVAKLHMYETLEGFVQEFLKTFPPNTRFMWQVIVADTNAKRVIPGTIDFMAILEDASVKIYDWKSLDSEFFDTTVGKTSLKEDVAWFKKKEYDIQIREYRKMFTNSSSVYARHLDTPVPGRNPQRFKIEVTESRAIPIAVALVRKKINPAITSWENNTVYDLGKVQIGEPDWSNTWRILKPVPTSNERTQIKQLDTLIDKIDKIYNDLFAKRYATKKDRESKNRELNRLKEAKRDIQVNHHINSTLNSLILTLNRLNRELTNADFTLIRRNLSTLKTLDNLKKSLEDVFSTISADRKRVEAALKIETDEAKKKLLEKQLQVITNSEEVYDKLADVDTNINLLSEQYRKRNEEQIQILADKMGIHNIFSIQRQISNRTGEYWFSGKSETFIKVVQVFNKLLHEAHNKSKFEFKDVHDKLVKSRKEVRKWAEDHNMTMQEALYKMLTPKSAEGEDLKFLAKWKKDFYSARDQAIAKLSGDDASVVDGVNWFVENMDFDKAAYEAEEKDQIDQINSEEFDVDPIKNAEARKLAIAEWKKKNNPFEGNTINKEGFNKNNRFLQPKPSWKTDEYQFLEKNKPLYDAYHLFRDIVKNAEKAGQVERWLFTRAVPNMENFISLGMKELPGKTAINLINSMYEEDAPMAKLDELGFPVNQITTKLTKDLGIWRERPIVENGVKKVQRYKDYSNVSKDLFSAFLNFAESSITAQNLQNIEDASLLLYDYEYNKTETIPTTKFGYTIEDPQEGKLRKQKITPEVNKNAEFLHDFIMKDLYHVNVEHDTALSKLNPSKFISRQIKKVNGGEEFLERLKEKTRYLSMKSLILAINSFNQLRILSFNFRAAGANFVVGMTNAWFEAGKKYNFADTLPPTNIEEIRKFLALTDYVLPGIEFQYSTRSKSGKPKIMGSFNEIRKDYGALTALGQSDIQRMLYSLMRETDKAVQYSVYLAMLRNSMIVDGQIVSIANHVKAMKFDINGKTYTYNEDKLALTGADRDLLEKKVDDKIQELKESSNLLKVAKISKDTNNNVEVKFDGLDRNSSTVSNFRIQVQEVIKDVLGSLTEEDTTMIRMSWMGTIMLTFKNWMPRQVRVRFGKFSYNSNKNAYDIGKHRLMWRHLASTTIDKDGSLHVGAIPMFLGELTGANYFLRQLKVIEKYGYDQAVSQAYDFYAQELLNRGDVETREEADAEMPSLGEFADLYDQKMNASLKEWRTILILALVLLAYNKLNDPNDESWWETFVISTIKRTLYDIGFWAPNFWYNLFKTPFPVLGIVEDIKHLFTHGTAFLSTGSNKEATMTKKYVMKVAPVTREYVNLRSMFDQDFRRKYDIQLKNYNW